MIFRKSIMVICLLGISHGGATVFAAERPVLRPGKRLVSIQKESFGKTVSGEDVYKFILTNSNGMEVSILSYGAIVSSMKVPGKTGKFDDVVLGCDSVSQYEKQTAHIGGIVGRYANRIAKGKLTIGGKTYSLPINNSPNHLHGGIIGFDKVVWDAKEFRSGSLGGVTLSYLSKDGEEGYPGNLSITVTYTLSNANEFDMECRAKTDKETVVNVTNHSYYNLAGAGNGTILNHELYINADAYTPIDEFCIPTGEFRSVANTPFDFKNPMAIGSRINASDTQLIIGKGYDHNYVLNGKAKEPALAARLYDRSSGRVMEILTTEPGIQLYTGNWLDSTIVGKSNKRYDKHFAVCLETEHFPDSPHHPTFPTTTLKPNESYSTKTILRFSIQ